MRSTTDCTRTDIKSVYLLKDPVDQLVLVIEVMNLDYYSNEEHWVNFADVLDSTLMKNLN